MITSRVQQQLFHQAETRRTPARTPATATASRLQVIRIATGPIDQPSRRQQQGTTSPRHTSRAHAWTNQEHDRFLEAMELHPSGPWKLIAAHVGTKTARQTITHAQKYREKIARRRQRHVTPPRPASAPSPLPLPPHMETCPPSPAATTSPLPSSSSLRVAGHPGSPEGAEWRVLSSFLSEVELKELEHSS